MKKNSFFSSLPFKLLVGVILGIIAGLILNATDSSSVTMGILNIVVTLKYVLGQLINFCVPLIIIGFIAPSITKLGNSASRMLGVALVIAYASSIGAALFSVAAGYTLIPHLSIVTDVDGLKELPEVVFELSIPQIMSVMSALVFSIMVGLAATWNKAKLITGLLDEFQKIVLSIVSKIIIPILPFFIGLTFCGLAYEGSITKQLPVFLKVIVIVLIGHFIWMTLLYVLAGAYSHENPWEVVRHYGPAYLTAVGTMSSAATPCRRTPECRQGKTTSQRYGSVWNSALCQYPSLRFCSDRSFLLHDNFQDSVRIHSDSGNHGSVLSSSWNLCTWSSWCPRRYCYGLPRYHYWCSWFQ